MDRKRWSLVFECALLAVVAVGVFTALPWPRETRLLPVTFGTVVVVMLIALVVTELARLRQAEARDIHQALADRAVQGDNGPAAKTATAGALHELAYLAAYAAGIWLLGFYPATALYLGLYLQRIGRFPALRAALIALAATALLLGLFVGLLGTDPYPGLLGRALF